METKNNDNAFPLVSFNSAGKEVSKEWGLSKREYFAAMAMQGICSGMDNNVILAHRSCDVRGVSELAVKYADALIEELNKS